MNKDSISFKVTDHQLTFIYSPGENGFLIMELINENSNIRSKTSGSPITYLTELERIVKSKREDELIRIETPLSRNFFLTKKQGLELIKFLKR